MKPIDNQTGEALKCSGNPAGSSLKLDKFGNLLFVENSKKSIIRVSSATLGKVFSLQARPNMTKFSTEIQVEKLYSQNTTSYIYALQGITVEREYLYWSNSHVGNKVNTPVSKAFAEPFIKRVPLQTFAINITSGARNLAANSAFLFVECLGGDMGNRLVALNKHGYTAYYFDMNVTLDKDTTVLKTYRDALLFIVEPTQISYLDVTKLQLNPYNGQTPVTPVTKQKLSANGNILNGQRVHGLVVISEFQEQVMSQFKTIEQLASENFSGISSDKALIRQIASIISIGLVLSIAII